MAKKEDKQLVKFKFMNHDRIGTIAAKVDAGTHPYLIYWKEGAYYRSVWLSENQIQRIQQDEADRR